MAGDNFDKGWVYVLHFTIPGVTSNFYKIGLTKNPVANRIAGLQTGNPFKIVEHHKFDSECMGLLEGHLHKKFATKRFRKEWFKLTPAVLKRVLKEGQDFSVKWNPLAIKARVLDKQTSIHKEMKPTKEHKKLHEKAVKLSRQIQKIELERDIANENLRRLTGNCIGIDGITEFSSLKPPAPSFKSGQLKKHEKKEWDKWQKTGIFKKEEGILGIGTKASNHAKLDKDLKDLKNKTKTIFNLSTYNQKTKSRTKPSRDYHAEYISCLEKLGELKAELDMIIIRFKLDCKRRKGIEGVFKYIRTDNNTEFDKKGFVENRPIKAKDPRWFFSSSANPSFSVEKAVGYS